MFIITQAQLNNICDVINNEVEIALDTEFIREKTYYPILSLIQIATKSQSWIIDVLSDLNLKRIVNILEDPSIIKIIHAPSQDIEVLYHYYKIIPKNIFDTQLAAQFVGFQDPPGYEKLALKYCNLKISKKEQHSKWLKRPLSKNQIAYALTDVAYLIEIKTQLLKEVTSNGHLDWFNEENSKYDHYQITETSALNLLSKFLKYFKSFNKLIKVYLLLVAREKKAKAMNIHRNLILTDEKIANITHNNIIDSHSCAQLDIGDSEKFFKQVENNEISKLVKNYIKKLNIKLNIDLNLFNALKVLLQSQSQKLGVSSSLIANRNTLNKLAIGEINDSKVFKGWRNDAYGQYALKLINSNIIRE